MRHFILFLILFAAGLESASAQRTGLFRKRRAYNAPAFNVGRFSEKTPQTVSAKDSTATDSTRRQALAQQRPATDSTASTGNKADTPDKANRPVDSDSTARPTNRFGQFFAENDDNDSTVVILRNGQVQEVRIRNGNVTIRNETTALPVGSGTSARSPRPIFAPDTLDEVKLAERDSAAAEPEIVPEIRRISPKTPKSARAKPRQAAPQKARPQRSDSLRRKTEPENTEADTSTRQPTVADSTDVRLGQSLDALQARIVEMEKRTAARADSARRTTGNRAARLEEDSVYVANTRRSEALQRRLDSLDSQRQRNPDTRQPLRERVSGWWKRNFGGKKNKETAQNANSATSGNIRQQTEARRDSLQRELTRLNNETETRRMTYRQPAPQPNPDPDPDNEAYAEDVRQLKRYTEQLRESLEEQRRLNRDLNRELLATNREAASRTTANVRRQDATERRLRDNADENRQTRTQPAERRSGVAILGLGNRREKTNNEDRLSQSDKTDRNEAELRRLTRQLDSLQRSLAGNNGRDTSANTQNATQRQLRALTDTIGALKTRLEQMREKEQPAETGNRSEAAFDASLLPTIPVFFETGGTRLSANAVRRVSQVAATLRQYPEARVVLTGMADATGDAATNRRVSEQRALAVKRLLTESYGIADDRSEVEAEGSRNASGKRNPLDRRVEIRFE